MGWRYNWYRMTHGLWHGDDWLFVLGTDIWDNDYGATFKHGNLPPIPGPSDNWRRWRVEWRVRFRWPIIIRRRTSR